MKRGFFHFGQYSGKERPLDVRLLNGKQLSKHRCRPFNRSTERPWHGTAVARISGTMVLAKIKSRNRDATFQYLTIGKPTCPTADRDWTWCIKKGRAAGEPT
ncbi:hypothetical protein FF011L_15780 [Roseimaritima multifibrata]|uniref:Uncharacterized protein n=1 Tax=Roseimaritima multifibrata TaxID=1930274 RepID=A0A517MD65_9BACT|nr:hypothetical protein FF011L_15780 [Roseimaritima multifibrata]